jgi:NDP-sugar pyrophosphorylase family protein
MSDDLRRAVILAGGLGSRLHPYTIVLPKPLMPIGDYPILEVIVRQLVQQGFGHITLAVNHHANLIQAFFGNGSQWGVKIDYSLESQPLGTIAPLALIPDLPEHFLLMNGDVLTDLQFGAFLDRHASGTNLFTISAARRSEVTEYGVLHPDDAGFLKGFQEKPVKSYLVSMGVYGASRKVLLGVPAGQKYGFDNLMHDMLARGQPVKVDVYDGYWLDIGRPDDYARAIDEFATGRERFLLG